MHHQKHHGPKDWAGCCSPRDIAQMKRMAGHFMKNFMGSFVPHNLEDLGTEYLITVPLAGRTKENVQVSIINKTLNITAKKPVIPEKEGEEAKKAPENQGFPFPWKGFTFIDVNMDIPLPADADEDTIASKMSNGLLRITVGKKPAKNININEESNN